MGCGCKNKANAIREKYGDGGEIDKKPSPLMKILEIIMQFAFGILCGVIIIVMIIPMLIYLIFCLMLGKQASFRIKDFSKFLNNDKV